MSERRGRILGSLARDIEVWNVVEVTTLYTQGRATNARAVHSHHTLSKHARSPGPIHSAVPRCFVGSALLAEASPRHQASSLLPLPPLPLLLLLPSAWLP